MIDSLIYNVSNKCDSITNICIEILSKLSKELHISYGEINVYLFLIIIPCILLYFIISTLICTNTKNEKIIKIIRYISYILLFVLIISTITIIIIYNN